MRIARGQRPGIVYLLPRAARPDMRLGIDAALHSAERPPTVLEIPETGWLEGNSLPRIVSEAWIVLAQAPHTQLAQEIAPLECTGRRSAPHTAATGVNSLLLPGINKESLMTWYKQRIVDDLV